jgi:broad specificity phosphatase PhoE
VLILVRHGRTAANAAGRLQGRVDHPLDETGRAQAERVASALGPVDRVVSSPLLRARQTAAAFGDVVEVDDRWIEIDYGTYDGVAVRDVPDEVWAAWRTRPAFVAGDGESYEDLHERVRAAAEELLADSVGRTVVVVSHVSPIKAALAWALDASHAAVFRCFLDQASITRIDLGPRGPVLRSFNETWHLADR